MNELVSVCCFDERRRRPDFPLSALMTRAKITVIAVASFAAGCSAQFVASRFYSGSAQPSTADHWKVVNDFIAYRRDPPARDLDASLGLFAIRVPPEYEPSLAALVSAGELRHVDLVLPLVPTTREVNQYWMEFCGERDDIIWASGNPEYVDYNPSGEQPLHLQLWFKTSAVGDVRQLIRELEELAAKADNSAQPAVSGIPAGSPHTVNDD